MELSLLANLDLGPLLVHGQSQQMCCDSDSLVLYYGQ